MKFRKPKNYEVHYEIGHRPSLEGKDPVIYFSFDRPIKDLLMTPAQARWIADNLHQAVDIANAHQEKNDA